MSGMESTTLSLQSILREQLGQGAFRDTETDIQLNLRTLCQVATEGKILLVLDDLWDSVQFRQLNCVNAENGSRVLVTTRSREVARSAKTVDLSIMSEPEAVELLLLTAGLDTNTQHLSPKQNGAIGDIIRHCGYLPLTLVSMLNRRVFALH